MNVPCDGCTLCCQNGDLLRLLPEDDELLYMTQPHPFMRGEKALAHKENGDCIYLDRKTGCTIHAHRPVMCRTFDCRILYKNTPKVKAKHLVNQGLLSQELFNRGKELSEN